MAKAAPAKNDLILVADNGKVFHVKMKSQNGGWEPVSVGPLDDGLSVMPRKLRDMNVTMAILPDEPSGGGCTCTLLNLRSIEPSLDPEARQNAIVAPKKKAAAKKKRG